MSTQYNMLTLHVGELIHCDVCMELDTSDYTELESKEHSDRVDTAAGKIIALVRADERKRIREALIGEASRYSNSFSIDVSTLCEIIGLTEEQMS